MAEEPHSALTPEPVQRAKQALMLVVIAGALFRLAVFLHAKSLFGDEALLAVNVVFRPLGDALLNLEENQVVPPLFLILSRLSLFVFKNLELSLRLVPLLSGIAALWLFARLAWRLVPGWFAAGTTTVVALHFVHVRYSTMFKHYSSDCAVTLILLLVALNWARISEFRRRVIAAGLPLLIALSLTAVFGLCGLLVVSLRSAITDKRKNSFAAPAILGLSTVAVGGVLWLIVLRRYQAVSFFYEFWQDGFPQGNLAWWPVSALVRVFDYLVGYPPLHALWALVCLVGFIALFLRRRDRSVAIFSVAAIVAGLGAAIFRVYPFSAERVTLWLAPVALVCLTKGLGSIWRLRPTTLFKPVAAVLVLSLLAWTIATIYVQGGELLLAEEMRAVAQRLSEAEPEPAPILVSKCASYAFRLYFKENDRAKIVRLPEWTLTLDQIGRGWALAGRPRRFWLVLTGDDFSHIGPTWRILSRFCVVRQRIEEGLCGAYLLQVQDRRFMQRTTHEGHEEARSRARREAGFPRLGHKSIDEDFVVHSDNNDTGNTADCQDQRGAFLMRRDCRNGPVGAVSQTRPLHGLNRIRHRELRNQLEGVGLRPRRYTTATTYETASSSLPVSASQRKASSLWVRADPCGNRQKELRVPRLSVGGSLPPLTGLGG